MLTTTLRSITSRKARLAMTGLAVVLGVAFMAGTLILTDTVRKTFDDLFADVYAGTDAVVRSSEVISTPFGPDQRGPVSASVFDVVETTDGVAAAEPAITFLAQIVTPDGEVLGGTNGPPSFGVNWSNVPGLGVFTIAEGDAPQGPSDVVVDRASAETGGLRIGDEITLLTSQPPRTFTLVGIATFGELDSPAGATVSLVTLDVASELFGVPDAYTEIGVVATDGTSPEQLVAALDARLPAGTEAVTGAERTAEDQQSIASALGFFNTFLLVFAVIALVVGSFIIYNTFSIVLAQRTRELALLRAIGASRRQVLGSVMGEALVVGVVASLVGLALGALTALGLRALLDAVGFGIPATSLVVTPTTVAVAVGVGTVITLLAAVFPALRASRIPPIAALRSVATEPKPPVVRVLVGVLICGLGVLLLVGGLLGGGDAALPGVAGGALFVFIGIAVVAPVLVRPVVRAIGWPLPRLSPVSGNLARRNAMRNPRRTASTAAALMIGVGLVGFIAVFASSATASVNDAIDRSFTGDLIIDSGQFVGGVSPQLADEVAAVPGVAASTGVRFLSGELDLPERTDGAPSGSGASFLLAVDTAALPDITDPEVVSGRVDNLAVDEVAVANSVAADFGLSLGDRLGARFPTGARTLEVVGTYDNRLLLGDWLIGLDTADLVALERLDAQIWVRTAPDADVATVQAEVTAVAAPWPSVEVLDLSQFKQRQADQFNQLLALVYVLLALAVVVALVGIANTLALSVYERTRELGLLRAVGMARAQVRSMVIGEAVLIAVFGTLLGLAIGLGFGWLLVQALSGEGLGTLSVPVPTLVVVVVLAAIAGVAAAALPAMRAGRLDVLDAISEA